MQQPWYLYYLYMLASIAAGILLARGLCRAFDLDGYRAHWRRQQAVQQAQAWAEAVAVSEREEWPPYPEPRTVPEASPPLAELRPNLTTEVDCGGQGQFD